MTASVDSADRAARPAPALRTGGRAGPGGWRGRIAGRVPLDVVVSWLVARFVVAAALAISRYVVSNVRDQHGLALRHAGLTGWDAGWYANIAAHGYGGAGPTSPRFFPLFPLVGRALAALPGLAGHEGTVLVVVANAAALAFAVALAGLARREGLDAAATTRAVWLAALAPPSFVLVMGYAEALFALLAVLVFLGARTRRWELAAAAGLLAGLCRPVGVLLVAPVAIEAARGLGASTAVEKARRAGAAVAPAVGTAIYLLWVRARYGDLLKPYHLQRGAAAHGSSSDPARVLWDAASGTFHGRVGSGLHVPWLMLALVLLVVMARRLPGSYTVWAALTLAAVLTGTNLDSSERYVYLGAFPFLLVGALLTARREVWWVVLTASTTLMSLYALLAFLTFYVP